MMIVNGKDVRLPKRFKDKWIKALRSGKYKQDTAGYLYDQEKNSHCCLSVAGVVAGIPLKQLAIGGYLNDMSCKGFEDKVPKILQGNRFNTNNQINSVIVDKLVHLNDKKRMSFNYIASYIERYL